MFTTIQKTPSSHITGTDYLFNCNWTSAYIMMNRQCYTLWQGMEDTKLIQYALVVFLPWIWEIGMRPKFVNIQFLLKNILLIALIVKCKFSKSCVLHLYLVLQSLWFYFNKVYLCFRRFCWWLFRLDLKIIITMSCDYWIFQKKIIYHYYQNEHTQWKTRLCWNKLGFELCHSYFRNM